jgi:hypothetical protein
MGTSNGRHQLPATPAADSQHGLSRRQVLASAGVVAVAAGVGVGPGLFTSAEAAEGSRTAAQPALLASTFRPLVGHVFRFSARSAERVMLRLEAVEGAGAKRATEKSFSLRFSGAGARKQGGEVGQLRGPGLAPLTLLVVPSGRRTAKGQDWVATIVGDVND